MLLLIIIKKIKLIEEPPPKIHSLPSLMSSFKRSVLSPIGVSSFSCSPFYVLICALF